MLGRVVAHDDGKMGELLEAIGGDDRPRRVDQDEPAVSLPERHRPPFGETYMDGVGQAALDHCRPDPGERFEPRLGRGGAEGEDGLAALERERLEHLVAQGTLPAQDVDSLHRQPEFRRSGDRGANPLFGRRLESSGPPRPAGRADEETQGQQGHGRPGDELEPVPRGAAPRPAAGFRRGGGARQHSHSAFSTIHVTSS